jgi:hypothetical protein
MRRRTGYGVISARTNGVTIVVPLMWLAAERLGISLSFGLAKGRPMFARFSTVAEEPGFTNSRGLMSVIGP